MAENQQLKTNEALCWQCGAVVYKGTKSCPKCGAPSPAVSIAKQRKVSLVLLCVGLPVGIISLIVGIVMFMEGMDEIFAFAVNGGLEIACLLIAIGIGGIFVGPFLYFNVKKREKQLSEARLGQ
jgi:hypothetical protein